MIGLHFAALSKYITANYGHEVWSKARQDCGVHSKIYIPIKEYPGEEFLTLVKEIARQTGSAEEDILKGTGETIALGILGFIGILINPEKTTLDLLEMACEKIMRPGQWQSEDSSEPFSASCVRSSEDTLDVVCTYSTDLTAFAQGIIEGIAKHLVESINITLVYPWSPANKQASFTVKLVPDRVLAEI